MRDFPASWRRGGGLGGKAEETEGSESHNGAAAASCSSSQARSHLLCPRGPGRRQREGAAIRRGCCWRFSRLRNSLPTPFRILALTKGKESWHRSASEPVSEVGHGAGRVCVGGGGGT